MKFSREPSLYITAIASILSLLAGFQLDFLSADQTALITAALTAALGIWNALKVRPVSPAAFTYAVGVFATLVSAYGLDVSQEMVGLINAAVLSVLALLLRGNVSPTAGPTIVNTSTPQGVRGR